MIVSKLGPRWSALVLLAALAAALACPTTKAHEIDDEATTTATTSRSNASIEQLIRRFRETGDDHYLDQAWEEVHDAVDSDSAIPSMLIDAATVAQSKHDFEQAIDFIKRALEIQPYNDQAWLLLASVHSVRGNITAAKFACQQLRGLPFLATVTCLARAIPEQSASARWREMLLASLNVARTSEVDAELLAWAQSVAGDLLATTDPETAIRLYETSLRHVESSQVRAALVDVLLSENSLGRASTVIQAGAPSLPLTIRRFIVAKRMNELDTVADETHVADHEFRHWIATGDWQHAREMARFYVDVVERPDLARRLAVRNLALQHEREDLLLERRTRM